mmetsp:Transcript_959/g.1199  ORF Transcript_959/g.1199 Transcript_959/m.1199 type:complete len:275 (-) Transcript_959:442-1266(-)
MMNCSNFWQAIEVSIVPVLNFLPNARNDLKCSCKEMSEIIERNTRFLRFHPQVSPYILNTIALKYHSIHSLILDNISWLSDEILFHLISRLGNTLKKLSIAYCFGITPLIFPYLPPTASVNIRGCWRLLHPCSLLSPYHLIEAQMNALKADADDSLKVFIRFMDESYLRNLSSSQLSSQVWVLPSDFRQILRCKKFVIKFFGNSCQCEEHIQSEAKAHFIVLVLTKNNFKRGFIWTVTERKVSEEKTVCLVSCIRPIIPLPEEHFDQLFSCSQY